MSADEDDEAMTAADFDELRANVASCRGPTPDTAAAAPRAGADTAEAVEWLAREVEEALAWFRENPNWVAHMERWRGPMVIKHAAAIVRAALAGARPVDGFTDGARYARDIDAATARVEGSDDKRPRLLLRFATECEECAADRRGAAELRDTIIALAEEVVITLDLPPGGYVPISAQRDVEIHGGRWLTQLVHLAALLARAEEGA